MGFVCDTDVAIAQPRPMCSHEHLQAAFKAHNHGLGNAAHTGEVPFGLSP
jgi:hypothetical protein